MLFVLYHIELRFKCWTIADVYSMYRDVSKSQYVIVVDVKQVRKAIEYKLTNKHKRNNIQCSIHVSQSTRSNHQHPTCLRFRLVFIWNSKRIPFLPECELLCCTKSEKKHVPNEWVWSSANQIMFFISWNAVNFFLLLSCSLIRLFILCASASLFFLTQHRLRYIHFFVNKFIFVSQIKLNVAYETGAQSTHSYQFCRCCCCCCRWFIYMSLMFTFELKLVVGMWVCCLRRRRHQRRRSSAPSIIYSFVRYKIAEKVLHS